MRYQFTTSAGQVIRRALGTPGLIDSVSRGDTAAYQHNGVWRSVDLDVASAHHAFDREDYTTLANTAVQSGKSVIIRRAEPDAASALSWWTHSALPS